MISAEMVAALERLAHSGYQPMHNGRPSCPFCGNFIDAEEDHTASCLLVIYLTDADDVREESSLAFAALNEAIRHAAMLRTERELGT
ncbi:MAG: hypothetical protein ABIO65_05285 [Nitrospiria bacterium]